MDYKQITSVEAAMKAKGYAPDFVPDFSYYQDEYMRRFKLAEFKLETVIAAINGSWVADWTDTKKYKHYPYWNVVNKKENLSFSRRGLSLYDVSGDFVYAAVAPCLCFCGEEECRFAAKNFLSLYEEYYFFKYKLEEVPKPSYKELVEAKLAEGLTDDAYKLILEAIEK